MDEPHEESEPLPSAPLLTYASGATAGLFDWAKLAPLAAIFTVLAAVAMESAFACLVADYVSWYGPLSRRRVYYLFSRGPATWRWYDNDAITLCSWAGGLLGLTGLVLLSLCLRRKVRRRWWYLPAMIMNLLAVAASPISTVFHALN